MNDQFSIDYNGKEEIEIARAIKEKIHHEISWIESLQCPNGAIRNSLKYAKNNPNRYMVTPYFANFAALALLKDSSKASRVKKYIEWYLQHLNWPDKVQIRKKKLFGTIDDYYILDDGMEFAIENYDSADSYAATFLSLGRAYYETTLQKDLFLLNEEKIKAISDVPVLLMQKDNLTWAKPNFKVKYLMDNCEVYKGLVDAAFIWERIYENRTLARYYLSLGKQIKKAIFKELLNGEEFFKEKSILPRRSANWKKWYPDVACQLYPLIFELISPRSNLAQKLYNKMLQNTKKNPACDWLNLRAGKDYPWTIMGYVSVLMRDRENSFLFYNNISEKFIYNETENYWNSFEAAWFVLMADLLEKYFCD